MIVQMQTVDSIDGIDLDTLFAESVARMDMNYIWAPGINDPAAKKNHYLGQIQSAIDGTWPLKGDTDTLFMFTTTVDGILADFAAGYKQADGIVSLRWNLASDNPALSNNWRFSPEARDERKRFSAEHGIDGFKHYTWVGSLIYRMLKTREQAGYVTLEEAPLVIDGQNPFPNYQMVTIIVRFV